ncbi:hypothetical protein C3E89_12690 [Clostridium sp. Cult1]|nr:hypothetical protein [Clostridium sp. Cult1]
MEEGDSDANYAYYALHKLKIRPGVLMGKSPLEPIDKYERAAIYAFIDTRVENEKKEADKIKK